MKGAQASNLIQLLVAIGLVFISTFGPVGQALAQPLREPNKVKALVSFAQKPGPAEEALIHRAGGVVERRYHIVPALAVSIPRGEWDWLRGNPQVASVEEDIIVRAVGEVLPWGVDRIDAEVVHAYNQGSSAVTGNPVKVAILDTGIDLHHPDLAVVGDVTFVEGTRVGDDDHGHGTQVAGVIAARDNDIGTIGVAPQAVLYAVKVLNKEGWGYSSAILSGIEWALDNGIQVVNLSFGSPFRLPSALKAALDQAYEAGILLVGAAGNSGNQGGEGDNVLYPARYDSVIAVGAINSLDARASFSSTGAALELVAPGVGVYSTYPAGYATGSGTSLASPHVAGTAALLIASGLTDNLKVRHRLQQTAQDLGTGGWDAQYGYGLVKADQAVPPTGGGPPTDSAARNLPPVAHAGPDQTVEATGYEGASVVLEGSDSYDPDGDELTFLWTWEGGSARGVNPTVLFPLGVTVVTLTVSDGELSDSDTVAATVQDTLPPEISVSLSPDTLWPPNGKMVEITATVAVRDTGDRKPTVLLASLVSNQAPGHGERDRFEDIQGADIGAEDYLFSLRAEKAEEGKSRIYTITYTARDASGNSASAWATVTVAAHKDGQQSRQAP